MNFNWTLWICALIFAILCRGIFICESCSKALLTVASAFPQHPVQPAQLQRLAKSYVPTEAELEQNTNAQYQFSSNVEDHINDLTQKRVEIRNGARVEGVYEYSDGYYKRTVHYVADENGYRVVNEEVVPLEGPRIDLHGKASVVNIAHGTELRYTVQSIPADGPVPKIQNHLHKAI